MRRFAVTGDPRGLPKPWANKLERILSALSEATGPDDVRLPGFRLHSLPAGADLWSVRVTADWRVTFRFENGEAVDVDLTDYH